MMAGVSRSARVPKAEVADPARLGRLLRDHYRLVWRTLCALGVAAECADDAAQRVFLVAADRLSELRSGKERSFLVQTAVRVAANARRSAQRRQARRSSVAPDHHPDPGPDPEAVCARNQARALLVEVLDTLPDELRTVFVLFELEGFTSAEIGRLLDIPPGTAASRLRRAREGFLTAARALRVRLHHEGGKP